METKEEHTKEIRWLLEEKYKGQPTSQFQKDTKRIKKGEHVDYVIGFGEFLGCKIDVSQKPFIPRPETEFWVEEVIGVLRDLVSKRLETKSLSSSLNKKIRVLDMFAGSGCVGIAVLKHAPNAVVDFAEKEKKFLKQIKINAKLNGIDSKRYEVIQSNVFSDVEGKYDYIFANPPYIAESKKSKVQKSVLENEPHAALFGGKDGLHYIRKFLKQAKNHLNPNGKIYMEFDSFQKPQISKIVRSHNFARVEFFRDQYKKWRYVVVE